METDDRAAALTKYIRSLDRLCEDLLLATAQAQLSREHAYAALEDLAREKRQRRPAQDAPEPQPGEPQGEPGSRP